MTFEALQELVQLITLKKIKHLGDLSALMGKTMELYRCIADKKVHSHKEATLYLYGSIDYEKAYKKLCSRLEEKLIALSLLTVPDLPGAAKHTVDIYKLYKDFAAAEILYGKGARKASFELMSNAHWRAVRYEVTWMSLESANLIRRMLVRDQYERRTWRLYTSQYERLDVIRQREILAVKYYENMVDEYIARQPDNQEIHQKALAYYAELTPIRSNDTILYLRNTYLIGIISYMACEDYHKAIALCDELYDHLCKRKYAARGDKYTALMQKFYCNIQLKELDGDAGELTAKRLLSHCVPGDPYWLAFMQYYFYYKTYTKDYAGALHIYREASSTLSFAKMANLQREHWLLFAGYLHLLFIMEKIADSPFVNQGKDKFKLLSFMSAFKLFTLDRAGLSLPLHLFPYLYNILVNAHEAHGFTIDALNQFKKRHTQSPVNTRTKYFIMLLLRLDDYRHNMFRKDKRVSRYIEALNHTPAPLSGQSFRIEIIPYQDLWSLLVQHVLALQISRGRDISDLI